MKHKSIDIRPDFWLRSAAFKVRIIPARIFKVVFDEVEVIKVTFPHEFMLIDKKRVVIKIGHHVPDGDTYDTKKKEDSRESH